MASELDTQAEDSELEKSSDVEPFVSSDTDDLSQKHEINAIQIRQMEEDNKVNLNNNNNIKAAYGRQQVEDGAALDERAREARNFRLMGRLHLWSKIKFVNRSKELPWNGKLAKTMYRLCHVAKQHQVVYWDTYKKLVPDIIGAKRSQVSKSIGERFKIKFKKASVLNPKNLYLMLFFIVEFDKLPNLNTILDGRVNRESYGKFFDFFLCYGVADGAE